MSLVDSGLWRRSRQPSRASICLLGPDGSGKSSVVASLPERLTGVVNSAEVRHLKPNLFFRWRRRDSAAVANPHGEVLRSSVTSVIKLLLWALELWLDRVGATYNRPELTIWDRYFHDLLVDPVRYRYGGPMWLARLLARCIPTPDLFIFLDAPAHVPQGRKQEVSVEETERQLHAYRDLASGLNNSVIIDVARNLDSVISDTAKVTIACLERKNSKARRTSLGQ